MQIFCLSDAVATCLLEEWPLTTEMFECDSLEGPIPRLFVSNLEEAKRNFTTNLDLAHKDILPHHREDVHCQEPTPAPRHGIHRQPKVRN